MMTKTTFPTQVAPTHRNTDGATTATVKDASLGTRAGTTTWTALTKAARVPRLAAWAALETTSILLQFTGFMVILLAQGIALVGARTLKEESR